MRIISVLFSFPPVYSGATKFWLRLIPRLKAYGTEVDIIYRAPDGEFIHLRADGSSAPVPEPKRTRRGTYKSGLVTIFQVHVEASKGVFVGAVPRLSRRVACVADSQTVLANEVRVSNHDVG